MADQLNGYVRETHGKDGHDAEAFVHLSTLTMAWPKLDALRSRMSTEGASVELLGEMASVQAGS